MGLPQLQRAGSAGLHRASSMRVAYHRWVLPTPWSRSSPNPCAAP